MNRNIEFERVSLQAIFKGTIYNVDLHVFFFVYFAELVLSMCTGSDCLAKFRLVSRKVSNPFRLSISVWRAINLVLRWCDLFLRKNKLQSVERFRRVTIWTVVDKKYALYCLNFRQGTQRGRIQTNFCFLSKKMVFAEKVLRRRSATVQLELSTVSALYGNFRRDYKNGNSD